jgi:preprotein translocase SecE subunit
MPTEDEDLKDDAKESATDESEAEEESRALVTEPREPASIDKVSPGELTESGESAEVDGDEMEGDAPAQLGAQRFVYAAYFTGAVAVAFLLSKAISFGWSRLAIWKPQVGEPDEMVAVVSAGIVGALVAFYYYRDVKVRTLAEEVASELGKVTWPTRDEVVNGTFVVLVTTFAATVFFALMDRFWGFVTNWVYGA